MTATSSVVTTRIADCVVIAVPDDLSGDNLRHLAEEARRCAATSALRAVVFDLSALKFADSAEFKRLIDLANMVAILGVKPLLAGLNPGIIAHLVEMNVQIGQIRSFLDLADSLEHLGLILQDPNA
jgi:rsbT antagonist protein RsbS